MTNIKTAEDHIKPSGLPVRCSSCFGQYTSRKHVDFGAACDRGFYGNQAANDITMDDLILCDTCIGEAARIIGWAPLGELKAKLEHLEARVKSETNLRKRAENYSNKLEDALTDRRKPVGVDWRQKPRPLRKEPVNG